MTDLHGAVESNDLAKVRHLISCSWIKIDQRNDLKRTPLHVACMRNRMEIVRCLVKGGANIYEVGICQKTALHYAILHHGNLEMVEFLVHKCRANVEAKDDDGLTPLHYAVMFRSFQIVQLLAGYCGTNVEATSNEMAATPLHIAAKNDNLPVARYLIDVGGACIETTDDAGRTAIHLACLENCIGVLEYLLLECGAVTTATDTDGWTALYCAVKANSFEIVQCLVQSNRVDIEAADVVGRTALLLACELNHYDIFSYFANECHANILVHVTSRDGHTVFHLATGSVNMLQDVLEICGKVSVNAIDNDGMTALHHAATAGRLSSVVILVVAGATVHTMDSSRRTPLHLASTCRRLPIVLYLLELLDEDRGD